MDKVQEKKILINDVSSSSFYQKEINESKVDVNNLKKKMNEQKAQDKRTRRFSSIGDLRYFTNTLILIQLKILKKKFNYRKNS